MPSTSTSKAKSAKSSSDPERASSPIASLDFLEDSDSAADKTKLSKGGKGKGKGKKRSSGDAPALAVVSAVEDDEVLDAAEDGEEGDGGDSSLIIRIRSATSKLYAENGSVPTNAQIADEIGEEEETVSKERAVLAAQRKAQRGKALRNAARKAGAVDREDASLLELLAGDVQQSLLTPSCIQKMAQFVPLDFSDGAFSEDETRMRIDLMHEKLPTNSARLMIAFFEPLFRSLLKECVENTVLQKQTTVKAATVERILSRFRPYMSFTGTEANQGLIRAGMKECSEPYDKKKPDDGYLMSISDANKKQFKKDNAVNAKLAQVYAAKVLEEKERLDKKRAASTEEADEGAQDEKPLKKSKKAVEA